MHMSPTERAGSLCGQTDQSTDVSPGTRPKSRWLRVTTVKPFSRGDGRDPQIHQPDIQLHGAELLEA
jgi:hypothetical protein